MKTAKMNEIITFVSIGLGTDENGVQVDNHRTEHFWTWAEVPKTTVREFSTRQDVGFTKDSPTFYIRSLTDEPINPNWRIEWNNRTYDIKSIDFDYQNKDMVKIKAELYVS